MFRKAFVVSVMFLLIGATLLATPRVSQAQHGGGGHIGGQFGGGHLGGTHFGGGYGGYHYNHLYGHDGLYHSDRYHDAYGRYYPYYGADGDYSPNTDETYPFSGMTPPYGSEFRDLYGSGVPYYGGGTTIAPAAGSYQSFYPPEPVTAPPDRTAHVTVHVPADARLWIDGTATTSTGSVREFQSPPLSPDHRYSYDLRAQWNENGHQVTQNQKVAVTAGGHVGVDFLRSSPTGKQTSTAK